MWEKWWDAKLDREEEELKSVDGDAYHKAIINDAILVSASAWQALREDVQRLESTIESFRASEERFARMQSRTESSIRQDIAVLASGQSELETKIRIIEKKVGADA